MDIPVIDQDPAVGIQGTYYVVDVNNNGAFDNGVDYLLKITQSNLPQSPASIEVVNSKGLFMDDDEGSTVKVTVKDANGDPISNVGVTINQHRDNKTAGTTADNILGFGNTDANGQFTVGFNCANNNHDIWTEKVSTNNGVTKTIVIECDRSQVLWTPSHVQSLVGSQVEAKGVLRLPSGGTLEGRTLALNLTPGTGAPADARFPTATQPTGTVAGSGTTATATTQAGGKFSVFLKDGATTGEELNDQIAATSPGLEITSDYPAGYPTNIETVDFLRSLTPTTVKVFNDPSGTSQADGLSWLLAGEAAAPAGGANDRPSPGGLGLGAVSAFNSDGVALVNLDVPLTITEGNFVNQADPFDPAPVVGAMAGEWKSAGKTQTINTSDSGLGTFVVNIERNAGFDDDGLVSDKVHAAVGSATAEHDFQWTTRTNPLNQGSFNVTLSADQESSILPKARAGKTQDFVNNPFGGSGQEVYYDVVTTDQFGNRTQQPINVTDNTPVAGFAFPNGATSQFDLSEPAIVATSPSAANQSLEVELPGATSYKYTDNPLNGAFSITSVPSLLLFTTFSASEQQKTTDAINWYALNFATSTFALTHEGASTVPAGTQVTSILTAKDQEGQFIQGLPTGFLRTGPSDDGDTDGNASDFTNENGEAFYDWAGNQAGLADVTAVVYNDNFVRQFTVGPDKVTFTGEEKQPINLKLTGRSDGNIDVIKVNADSNAHGAMAVVKRGGEIIRSHRLNNNGNWNFRITDHNGNQKATKYRVVVAETASTLGESKRISQK